MAYSDQEIAEAMVKLAVNKYDFDKTAKDTGISVRTLRRWDKNAPKKGVSELLERAIERILMVIPENMSGKDWAVALGILLDKYQLLRGQPTSRVEAVMRYLESLPDEELDELERQFTEAAGHAVYKS